ncbi:dihydrofolate reductase [Tumebacillus permanentifrigoris]|uniref:Dihydrofolate reductase n=1 Tax=Tumebacillus permanentifrigoris TaxID=378543 RepID=A0A316DEQ4_9BACL|nr:dihydrofolate reductase [Tumebacillus permanentifrigoris]PWK16445.1 dihydrofolate reductase [Tumebacillus permanentifrigoris]
MISMIVAMDENRVIGLDNDMPWKRNLPADLQHFKRTTMGHTVVMGRKTFESIGRPLPGRRNVVLTRQTDWHAAGVDVIHSLDEIDDEVMIIGGAELFREMLSRAERLYITVIHHRFDGDTFFPEIDRADWQLVHEQPGTVDDQNQYPHTFTTYVLKK